MFPRCRRIGIDVSVHGWTAACCWSRVEGDIDGPSLDEDASFFRFIVDSVDKWAECPLSSSSGLWGPVTPSDLLEFLEQEPRDLPPACLR